LAEILFWGVEVARKTIVALCASDYHASWFRWAVERTLSWLNRFRRLKVRVPRDALISTKPS
jgi:transposase